MSQNMWSMSTERGLELMGSSYWMQTMYLKIFEGMLKHLEGNTCDSWQKPCPLP